MLKSVNILKLVGSLLLGLVLAAAPVLQAAQIADNSAPKTTTCGCCCCGTDSECKSGDNSGMDQGSCGCSVSDSEPVAEAPLDLQPRANSQPDADTDPDGDHPEMTVDLPVSEPVLNTTPPTEHSPPLYIQHATYLI